VGRQAVCLLLAVGGRYGHARPADGGVGSRGGGGAVLAVLGSRVGRNNSFPSFVA